MVTRYIHPYKTNKHNVALTFNSICLKLTNEGEQTIYV